MLLNIQEIYATNKNFSMLNENLTMSSKFAIKSCTNVYNNILYLYIVIQMSSRNIVTVSTNL